VKWEVERKGAGKLYATFHKEGESVWEGRKGGRDKGEKGKRKGKGRGKGIGRQDE
jgi:hypothetical protein